MEESLVVFLVRELNNLQQCQIVDDDEDGGDDDDDFVDEKVFL